RERRRLPQNATDLLTTWLHCHPEHPFPSKEVKKQLSRATGLSLSQISTWMTNV
ncbi:hypothetical protein R3P38DRAFT_2434136, partial [Favolaschia claudopus]